jgi:putative AbiEii toxin of type IV toxin-antitoxin system
MLVVHAGASMIRGVQIARFRGICELAADGFGRVNLVIGKNDCGKTAFMEALQLADDAEDAVHRLLLVQRSRLKRAVKSHDLERFWQPLFFDLDAKIGLSIWIVRHDGARHRLEMRQGAVSEEIISDHRDRRNMRDRDDDDEYDSQNIAKSPTWVLELQLTGHDQTQIQQRVVGTPTRIKLPPASNKNRSAWITSGIRLGEDDIRFVSALKQRGQEGTLLELLREVDGRLSGIELLAPGGDVAELFVRLDNGTPMLPMALMGDGFQRCLELGSAAAAHDSPTLFIDEIENGMHHLVLEPLWRWIATISSRRNLQVFATTHSEECIQAACRAFHGLNDEGLRVIRLDRLEGRTRATIYDRALVETAERTGTEIRG